MQNEMIYKIYIISQMWPRGILCIKEQIQWYDDGGGQVETSECELVWMCSCGAKAKYSVGVDALCLFVEGGIKRWERKAEIRRIAQTQKEATYQ